MAVKEGSKVANRDWIDHEACSLLQYINVKANLFKSFLVHEIRFCHNVRNVIMIIIT